MNTIVVDRDIVQQALDNYHEARNKAIAEYKEAQEKADKVKCRIWNLCHWIPKQGTLKELRMYSFFPERLYYEAGDITESAYKVIYDRLNYLETAKELKQLLKANPDGCPILDANGCKFVNDWKGD